MTCRNDSGDPRKCDRCGEFLWTTENGRFCGECGVTMPCTMRVLPPPPPSGSVPPSASYIGTGRYPALDGWTSQTSAPRDVLLDDPVGLARHSQAPGAQSASARGPGGLLAPGRHGTLLVRPTGSIVRTDRAAPVRPLVPGLVDQPGLQLSRPVDRVPSETQGGVLLGRGARRPPGVDVLSTVSRGEPPRLRSPKRRRPRRRPHHALPPHDPGTAHRDARGGPPRSDPLRCLRRVRRARSGGTYQRLGFETGHYGGRRLAPR